MATMFGMYPFLMKLYADGGYQGPLFRRAVAKIMARVNVEIVKRSDHAKGFVVLPKRWVVERTFAWLGRCRRLAKDWENLNRKALAFLRLASIRIMLRTPQLLLLDEPTNNLDLVSVSQLEAALNAYEGAFVIVSHDERFLDEVGIQRRLRLSQGRLESANSP